MMQEGLGNFEMNVVHKAFVKFLSTYYVKSRKLSLILESCILYKFSIGSYNRIKIHHNIFIHIVKKNPTQYHKIYSCQCSKFNSCKF